MTTKQCIKEKTFLFDFDGTLVDSIPEFISLMLRILDENGIKYGSDIVKIITPLGYHGTAEYFRTLGIDKTAEELVSLMQKRASDAYTNKIPAKCGVIETLRKMKKLGYRLNILTASPHSALDPCLKRLEIFDLFENVWSCDDFCTTKSNPEIYKMAAERLLCNVSDVIFVDDNVNAIKTAKSAGMTAYGIYDPSSDEYICEMKRAADRYVMSFDELLEE